MQCKNINEVKASEPLRLLCIVSSMDAGGAETFLMKMLRSFDKSRYILDFCVCVERKCFYEDEINSYGSRIFRIVPKSEKFFKSFSMIKNFVKSQGYKHVMVCNQYELSVVDLIAARSGGARTLVYRANSTCIQSGGRFKNALHNIIRGPAMLVPNVKIAPSEKAADFVFGKNSVKKGEASILHNGINTELYEFSPKKRAEMREKLGCGNKIVILQVGRFSTEKNHSFILNVFTTLIKSGFNYMLLFAGDGMLRQSYEDYVHDNGLENSVSFLGVRNDVPDILQAADVLVLPSLYEGMPNAVIEAQGAGLPCFVSDTITREADKTGMVKYLPLEIINWVDELRKFNPNEFRQGGAALLQKEAYDIESVSKRFIKIVFHED